MNTPAEAFAQAKSYCLTCFAGLFFIYGYNLVSAILRGMGDSRHPLIFIAIAAITNLILDIVFVIVFSWGVFGAALATVIGQALSFIASIILLYRRREEFNFDFKPASFKPDRATLRSLMKLGIPFCLQSIAINFSMLFVSAFINAYGVVASAVTGIGEKLAVITATISMALATAGGSMIGQCLGAGKVERVPRVISFSLLVNIAFATVFAGLTIFMPRAVFGLFNTEPEVLEMALSYIVCAVLNYYGFALRAPFFALINGVGHAQLNLTVGLLDGVVCRIGLALLLGITVGMGIKGFWYGNVLAGYVPVIIGGVYFLSGKWKTHKLAIPG
jgi:putative MATE family efflux protein